MKNSLKMKKCKNGIAKKDKCDMISDKIRPPIESAAKGGK